MRSLPEAASFLSEESGTVVGRRLTITRSVADWAYDLAGLAALTGPRTARLARGQEPRRVLVLSIYRPDSRLPRSLGPLHSDRHEVRLAFGATAESDARLIPYTVLSDLSGGKFENLNRLLAAAPDTTGFDWTIVVDDDIGLPHRFLDRFLAVCERLRLDLAQPAQTMRSHSAWRITRRRPFSLARSTQYVEIGPLTAFSRRAATELLPFPELRFGWGLDNHWAAVAQERGWRLGIVDALPVRHESQPVATTYTHAEAIDEGRRFLADRSYISADDAQRTLETHRRLPR